MNPEPAKYTLGEILLWAKVYEVRVWRSGGFYACIEYTDHVGETVFEKSYEALVARIAKCVRAHK